MSEDNTSSVLEISPSTELKFTGPFTSVVTSHLKLRNNGTKPLCYKVKTTAPKMYCVRPNSGLIEPSYDVDISVMLQPFDYSTTEKLKHKFLIQSTVMDEKLGDNFDQLWRSVGKDDVTEIKLRCVFENPLQSGDTLPNSDKVANISNNAHTGLSNNMEDMKKQLEELKAENNKLRENESRLRKIALQDTLENSSLPQIVEHTNQSVSTNVMMLAILCFFAFVMGLILGKFSL